MTPEEKEKKELGVYRETLGSDIIEVEKNYHTTITYIAAGALGFILTINEKFFSVREGQGSLFLFVSIAFLLLTIFLLIISSLADIRASERMRDTADDIIEGRKVDKQALNREWKKQMGRSRFWFYMRFAFLMIGIIAEILFVYKNMNFSSVKKEVAPITLEWKSGADSSKITLDTSNHVINISIK